MFEKGAEEYANHNDWFEFSANVDKIGNAIRTKMKRAYLAGAEFGYNKAKEELEKDNNRLFLEGAKRVEELEAQIEKMKCDVKANIKWADTNKNNQMYCKLNAMINQWETKEND